MDGLMMDFPLTLTHVFDRAAQLFGKTELVSRLPDKSIQRSTYGAFHSRARKLAAALRRLGVKPGERVATLAWNHARHLETYFAVPLGGAVLHTINPRLAPADLAYIMNDAEDAVLLIDDVLLPVLEKFRAQISPRHVIVFGKAGPGTLDYEELIAAESDDFDRPQLQENQAACLCYTSGTTARPKGVLYSHRSIVLHSLSAALPDALNLSVRDVVLPVVPMFHVNAWGLPFSCTMLGIKQVLPGPHLDAQSLLSLIQDEQVTVTAGVPTVWMGMLDALDKAPGQWNVKSLHTMVVGGSAAPQAMIEAFQNRHGLRILHAWGMTEMSPIGTVSRLKPSVMHLPAAEQMRLRASQGTAVPFVELRIVGDDGPAPWDGKAMGELQARGPWIARQYFKGTQDDEHKFTADGWLRTGDVATMDAEGYVHITDRAKDLVKSGGEWISSVELENALMGHPAIKEAAVIAIHDPKWQERPLACVVLKDGASATDAELRAFLEPKFAKFWLPDAFVRLEALPRTATGKFQKSVLREKLKDFKAPAASTPA